MDAGGNVTGRMAVLFAFPCLASNGWRWVKTIKGCALSSIERGPFASRRGHSPVGWVELSLNPSYESA
jgi:hypothetical protein